MRVKRDSNACACVNFLPSQFERTNPVRYAAVIYSMQDIESLFAMRNRLMAEIKARGSKD